ncbi:MAG: cytochrome c biogenesis protein CcmG/thiol:disulfide interchange protein DsbE [Parvicellaceae bacterium]|jgi:cytochrome c biogenesis protein CcmG/thiol:disulfide interchange protein DsbE
MRILFFLIILITSGTSFGQSSTIPSTKIVTLEGVQFDTKSIDNGAKPTVIIFWATWCKSSKSLLNNIADEYEDWQDDTGVKIIAISHDDQRSQAKVKPTVNASGWEYEIYLDKNSDFYRAMGVQNCPHVFLLNAEGSIVFQESGYLPGNEDILLEKIEELVK